MSFSVDFYQRSAARSRAAAAIEFLKDPTAKGRAYAAEHPGPPNHDVVYPYSLGAAEAHIESLLDVCGYPVQGPDRFDCEYALTHPYVDGDLTEVDA